jgi:hypothetical protein
LLIGGHGDTILTVAATEANVLVQVASIGRPVAEQVEEIAALGRLSLSVVVAVAQTRRSR